MVRTKYRPNEPNPTIPTRNRFEGLDPKQHEDEVEEEGGEEEDEMPLTS
jgi:hypothetical protein